MIRVFTDGACLGNPGRGGWAVKIRYPSGRIENISGAAEQTTNNRMELTAAIKALEGLKNEDPQNQDSQNGDSQKKDAVVIHSDSQYLVRGMNEWIVQWQRRGWRTASKKPVLNEDLWQELLVLVDGMDPKPQFRWVRGHDDIPDNEEVDRRAQAEAQNVA